MRQRNFFAKANLHTHATTNDRDMEMAKDANIKPHGCAA